VLAEVRAGGVIPAVDRIGMGDRRPSLSRQREWRQILPPPCCVIEPCLPSPADRPPSGPGWVQEIKHDGFRLLVRRDPAAVRLLTRNGHEIATR
jgi:hypothetical protein